MPLAQQHVTIEIESVALRTSRRVTVWLPDESHSNARYPVLYLNDGQNLFDPARAFGGVTWRVAETAAALIECGAIPPLAIVGIDHGGMLRAREYLPVEDERNPSARKPLGAAYAHFVTAELMPRIERAFPVARGPSQTGFGGSSYGAIAALYTVIRAPGVFGRLLLESPSLYVGRAALLRQARTSRRWPQRIYLGVGTNETSRADWNDETVSHVTRLAATLRAARLGPRRLRVAIEEGASHSEAAWAQRLPHALQFLYGR
jgi:predicted alpha/beta superfamily hydrolase